MPQLLIELQSEEIPARMQLGAARDFERLFGAKLTASGLTFEAIKAYVGPRRLALVVDGLPVETTAVTEEVKGPKEGAPEQAMAGFLRKVGLTQDQLTLENGVWLARIEKPGRKTADSLGAMLMEVILGFPWPKSMRSGTSSFRWVRPLKRILFLFDGQVIPFELEGLVAGNQTVGHRYLSSGEPFVVSDFTSYHKRLADNSVILDHAERQAVILDKARAVCEAAGCELMDDQGLLEEVAGLNEWPVPILGDMDPRFLTLPPEVIKTSMRTHQKYFAVRDKTTGKMAAHFVIVANTKAVDGGEEIKRGNAKVLSARLSDGVFFWTEDNKAGNFDGWLERLKGTTFHVKLGTMAQRVERITALAKYIAPLLKADASVAGEAARLAKADLASKMVGEFPELQGVMGGYYADAAKLPANIANAVREHYKPQGPGDTVPTGTVSATVALADKIDTLVGFFAIDEKPTGSKDPYALRRSALGILRILREHNVRLSLSALVEAWFANVGSGPQGVRQAAEVTAEILDFFTDRLKVQLREDGRNHEVIDAVLANKDDDMVRVVSRIDALDRVLQLPQGQDALAAHKRAANILAAEAKKGTLPQGEAEILPGAPDVEIALIRQLKTQRSVVENLLNAENIYEALLSLAALRQNVDAFLDGVLVNADDSAVRANRLKLLAQVCALSKDIADLSKIA
jgi:glycyl-tRNA synthetase beta chain